MLLVEGLLVHANADDWYWARWYIVKPPFQAKAYVAAEAAKFAKIIVEAKVSPEG
jgi:hypothetical protein